MSNQFIGETLAGKYRIDSVLRENDSGKIYLATHLSMDKPVGVKILAPALASDDAAVKAFSAEARTTSRIAHPNVLSVTDFGSDANGAIYAVLEDASGETLTDAIREKGKFPLDRAVRIAWQTASALSAAHAVGVIHGQLNSDNILLAPTADNSETVKVLGFGAAKSEKNFAVGNEPNAKDLEYLAPEQNASEAATERSDVYALGVILYEMLAGEVPFTAETANALVMKQAQNPPTPLSAFRADLPEELEMVVLKTLAVNPEMRYQTATEFANALNAATNNAGGAPTILIADESDVKNNLWKTAFVVLAGITILAAGLIYATSVKQTNVQTQLQTDANGSPVQPINPATGMNEQGLSSMMPYSPQTGVGMMPGGATGMPMPQPVPNGDGYGDGYNAWGSGRPPAGAPPPQQYVGPNGQVITIPGGGTSQFMPNENGTGYIMVPANTNTNPQTSPTPKNGKTPPNANTAAPQTSPTPPATGAQTPPTDAAKPTPTPVAPKVDKTPAKPAATPKNAAPKTTAPPASTGKTAPSGTVENS